MNAATLQQTHEMNAVRRSQMAGRYGPVDRKKNTRPMALCVGAVPVRAARCDIQPQPIRA